jgi:hypothetical protein
MPKAIDRHAQRNEARTYGVVQVRIDGTFWRSTVHEKDIAAACQFADSWGHLSPDFCSLMGPPDFQGHGATRQEAAR